MLTDHESKFLALMSGELAPDTGLQTIGRQFADRMRAELPTLSDVDIAKVLTTTVQIGLHIHDGLQQSDAYRDCPLHGFLRIMTCSAVQLTDLERDLPVKSEE